MRLLTVLVLWAATAGADEPDAAVAPAGRWSDPAGTPSGGRRSAARPLLGEIEEAWSVELPGTAAHAPVLWDGTVYVLCHDEKEGRILAAIDLYAGRLLAKRVVQGAGPGRAVVWNGVVYIKGGPQIVAYRRSRTSFKPVWKSKDGRYSDPVVWDGEIYAVNHDALERLRLGSKRPVWRSAARGCRGRAAVYGRCVYAVDSGNLHALERRTGRILASVDLPNADRARRFRPGDAVYVTVAPNAVYVQPPFGFRASDGHVGCAEIPRFEEGDLLKFGEAGLWDFRSRPSVHAKGVVATFVHGGTARWGQRVKDVMRVTTSRLRHPDLFEPVHPAVILGDLAYLGRAAVDIRSDEVLWRLPVGEMTQPPVPADGMVLAVDGGTTLRCFQDSGRD
ncbi:MAG: PQQ-binding-like beta-propeller repeat protein [Planctomycetota bacterium]|nr:PQQ-binding-like beta-propeller repeat protein [Planctomycetota bacterium]